MPQIKDNGKLVKTTLLENRSFYFIVSVCLVYFIFISFLFYLIFLIIHKQKVSKISSKQYRQPPFRTSSLNTLSLFE